MAIQTLPENKKKRRLNLKNLNDARRLVARTVKELQGSEISPDKARALASLINTFVKTYEISELEKKLTEIQTKLGIE